MPDTTRDALNRANSTTFASHAQRIKLGDLLAAQLPQAVHGASPAASSNELATLESLALPITRRAAAILRATSHSATAGGPGELDVQAYGTTPTAGQVAVSPCGDIVTLAVDVQEDVDVLYVPEIGEVIEHTGPVATAVMTLPAWIVARNPKLLLEATADTVGGGGVTGRKIILVPATAAVATTKAALAKDRTKVYFNNATDLVTSATVKILVAPVTDLGALLDATPPTN